VVGSE
jgi:hypothetical protein